MIALDVETTGLKPDTYSILAIGAVDTDDVTNQFYGECRMWEGAQASDEALAINGFTRAEIEGSERQSEADLIRAFVAWATDRPENLTLVAQNVSFDYDFVRAACARADVDFPFAKRTIDTHTLVWLHMTLHEVPPPLREQRSAINLDFALRYCGVPEEPKPHNGLTGAYCHAEVFSRIAYNKKALPEFNDFDIPWLTTS